MKSEIGHYQLVSELGRGGMGVVYKAYEPALERYVAIKELSSALSHDPDLVQRFVREARAMAALNDPHILQIHFIGQDGEQPYFAMEFVDGESLSSLLEREGPLKTSDALKICQQAARGLASAHAQGVIHRDIKPSNLMLNKRDQLKIADFGIAFTQRDLSKKLTATGDVVGTPGYLSPEVCLGNRVDARSDLFALGIVLYEMLSGQIPFNDPSPLKLMLSVVESEVPDIRQLNASIDQNAVGILDKLLAKNPDDRFQSADALSAAIAAHPAMSDQALSVHAHLPPGAASTLLATPGLAKAASQANATKPALQNNPIAHSKDQAHKLLWPGLGAVALLLVAGIAWINRPAPPVPEEKTSVTPAQITASSNTAAIPAIATPTALAVTETTPDQKPAAVVIADKNIPAVKPEIKIAPAENKPRVKPNTAPLQVMEKYGEIYLGPQNEVVSVAQVNGEDIAYIKATGIRSPFDGKVIRAIARPSAHDGKDYAIVHNGSDYVVLVMRKYPSRGKVIELYLPGLNDGIKLSYDAALSKQLNTDSIRDEFLKQK